MFAQKFRLKKKKDRNTSHSAWIISKVSQSNIILFNFMAEQVAKPTH